MFNIRFLDIYLCFQFNLNTTNTLKFLFRRDFYFLRPFLSLFWVKHPQYFGRNGAIDKRVSYLANKKKPISYKAIVNNKTLAKYMEEEGILRLIAVRQMDAIKQAEKLAGWRLYVTNVAPEAMSLEQSINYYRDEWQPERGFHRWKRGGLPALPIYLKYESRIRGLMILLAVGLRVLTLVEFVVRRELDQRQTKVAGLYEGNPKRATDRPTTERLFRAFKGIALYRSQTDGQVSYQLSSPEFNVVTS